MFEKRRRYRETRALGRQVSKGTRYDDVNLSAGRSLGKRDFLSLRDSRRVVTYSIARGLRIIYVFMGKKKITNIDLSTTLALA